MSRVSTAGKPKLKAALRGVLTDVVIRQAKPAEKPYKLSDGGGMFLLINPYGSKYWRPKYRIEEVEKLLSRGVTLKSA
jgi:hypothetical protein